MIIQNAAIYLSATSVQTKVISFMAGLKKLTYPFFPQETSDVSAMMLHSWG